jgi:hypothetical protein
MSITSLCPAIGTVLRPRARNSGGEDLFRKRRRRHFSRYDRLPVLMLADSETARMSRFVTDRRIRRMASRGRTRLFSICIRAVNKGTSTRRELVQVH